MFAPVAYKLTCDVGACGAVIDEAPRGLPTLAGKINAYCSRCQAYIAAVDQEMVKVTTLRSMELASELNALRDKKIAEALPQQKGGEGLKADWEIVVPEARP